jgi:8-oxo-dGTP pyrophosphatase MutT (NUDIX family)
MRVTEIVRSPQDQEHQKTLDATGFWGKAGAGCIFLAKTTQRIGIVHRSMGTPERSIEQPGTWGTIGGAIDPDESPEVATVREAEEEIGYHKKPGDYLIALDEFESGSFRYTTFLYVVEDEFQAEMNWEAQAFAWFDFPHWPEPLHFGIEKTLEKSNCLVIIQTEIRKYQDVG